MKKTITTIALFAVLSILAVSCQKEPFSEQTPVVAENSIVYKVTYTIDGKTHMITLVGEDTWKQIDELKNQQK